MVRKLDEGETVPFAAHLEELRQRLIHSIIVVGVLFFVAFAISDKLLEPLSGLMREHKLVFISPTEAFFVHMKIAFYASLAVSVPYLLYQVWSFLSPGLLKEERKLAFPFILGSSIFFGIGVSFCYFLVLPFGLNFLLGYGGSIISPMISASAFLGFCMTLMFVFGIVFQLPLIVIFLNRIDLVSVEQLASFRPYLIVSAFVLSALITPPDIFTQVVLSLPLIILYELSIVVINIFGKKAKEIGGGSDGKENSDNATTDSSS